MEEKEKKRQDPYRDYVISEGNFFLGGLKFHNPVFDGKKIGEN